MARTPKSEQTEAISKGHVRLPDTVKSAEAEWPGSTRGRKASPLRDQIVSDLEGMELGSVRRYDLKGDREQNSFLSLFRKCVDEAFVDEEGNPAYGVQSSKTEDAVFVRISDRVSRPRK